VLAALTVPVITGAGVGEPANLAAAAACAASFAPAIFSIPSDISSPSIYKSLIYLLYS
jgi:hypothetical protein